MSNQIAQVKNIINSVKDVFVSPEAFEREKSFAIQQMAANQQLLKCTPQSLVGAVKNVALIGLTLNPAMKLAYLIPRWSQGGMTCVLEPSYQGIVKLLTDTGSVNSVFAHLVYDGDDFEMSLGTSVEVRHFPKFQSKQIKGCYAVAELKNAPRMVEYMTIEQLHEIRELSESYKAHKAGKLKSCVWVQHEGEMCRKTVIKRIAKYVPKTDTFERVATAIEIDNQDYQASDAQQNMIAHLLEYVEVPEEVENAINSEMADGLTPEQATVIIEKILEFKPKSLNERFKEATDHI